MKKQLIKVRALVDKMGLEDFGASGLTFPVKSLTKDKIYKQQDTTHWDESSKNSPPFFVDDNGCSRNIANAVRNGTVEIVEEMEKPAVFPVIDPHDAYETFSSEIELAIKIGRCILNPAHYESKKLQKTLDELNISLQHPYRLNKHLQAFCEHKGDTSLIQYVEDFHDNNYYENKLQCKKLAYFITGLNFLYPVGSMSYIIKQWAKILNTDFFNIKSIYFEYVHEWAKELYENN